MMKLFIFFIVLVMVLMVCWMLNSSNSYQTSYWLQTEVDGEKVLLFRYSYGSGWVEKRFLNAETEKAFEEILQQKPKKLRVNIKSDWGSDRVTSIEKIE